VTIFLPRAAAASDNANDARSAGDTPAGNEARSGHVLLVDDDPDVRSAIAQILREAGHLVTESATASAAADILDTVSPPVDLLLADIAMPDMSGLDLAGELRRAMPHLPILFMAGCERSGPPTSGAGIEIIRKPFEPRELQRKIARMFHQYSGGSIP
jgi:DNA-binding response OmpR family regulator